MSLEEHLQKIQSILRLNDWDIELTECIATEAANRNFILYNDKSCEIFILSTLCESERLRTLIHELLHLVNRDSYDIASENLEESLEKYYTRHNERAIEQLAKAFYEMYCVYYVGIS